MKKTVRIAALLLAAAALLTVFAGCSAYNHPKKYLNVPDYKSIKITKTELEDKLKEAIDSVLDDMREPDYVVCEDAAAVAEIGDEVNITYVGTAKDLPDLSDDIKKGMRNDDLEEGSDLVLGSKSFITAYESDDPAKANKGFEEQLVGAKKGDKVTVTVTFPSSYQTVELQDAVVDFEVTVNSISKLKPVDKEDKKTEVGVSFTFIDPLAVDFVESTDAGYALKSGDKVVVSFDGTVKTADAQLTDSAKAALKATDKEIVLGNASVTKEFDEALIGQKTGASLTVKVTFPSDYSDVSMRGVEVEYAVTIGKIFESKEIGLGEYAENTKITVENEKVEGEKKDVEFDEVFGNKSLTVNFAEDDYAEAEINCWKLSDFMDEINGKALFYEYTYLVNVPDDPTTYGQYASLYIPVTVKIESITTEPEWNDETVKKYADYYGVTDFATVAEFTELQNKNDKCALAYERITEAFTVKKYPKKETNTLYKNQLKSDICTALSIQDISALSQKELDQLIAAQPNFDYAQVKADALTTVKTSVKARLVNEYLIDEFGIKLSGKEYKEMLQEYYDSYSYQYMIYYQTAIGTIDDFELMMGGKESLEYTFKVDKLYDYLGEHCNEIVTVE